MKGFEIKFNIYAEDGDEAEKAKEALVGFINIQAKEGRAVSATKIIEAMNRLEKSPFIKMQINNFFK